MNIRTWGILAILMAALTGPSMAATNFDFFKMVGATELGNASLSQTNPARTTYNLNEIPYLYYHVNTPILSTVMTFWISPLNSSSLVNDFVTVSDSDGWITLGNWNSLPPNQKVGQWRVTGFLKNGRKLLDCDTLSFVVTPEPMAMVLYGIGGLPLAAHFLRRRKVVA